VKSRVERKKNPRDKKAKMRKLERDQEEEKYVKRYKVELQKTEPKRIVREAGVTYIKKKKERDSSGVSRPM
jgi:hypothetical protein